MSAAGRRLVASRFSLDAHVDQLVGEYAAARSVRRVPPGRDARASSEETAVLRELVVCSLEEWNDVWRRNQFLVDGLLRRTGDLRVLFVEPATDPLFDLTKRRVPRLPHLRRIDGKPRLWVLRPLKPLPRRFGVRAVNASLRAQVILATRLLGFKDPTLWINDVTYAPLIRSTRWPALYDVTDDWLAAPLTAREHERLEELERLALEDAAAVVVCSPGLKREAAGALARCSSYNRTVWTPRTSDSGGRVRATCRRLPVAVYVGSLHESEARCRTGRGACARSTEA